MNWFDKNKKLIAIVYTVSGTRNSNVHVLAIHRESSVEQRLAVFSFLE
jgi:hypothetical protein